MTYVSPYPGGFVDDSSALATSTSLETTSSLETDAVATPLTAEVLNQMEVAAITAANRITAAASAAARPSLPSLGDVVYRSDLGWHEVFDGSWRPMVPRGSMIQFGVKRSDVQTTYSSPTSGDGTPVTELALTVTPRYASSDIVLEYVINGEYDDDWDNMFLMHRDGSLITTHPPGYNYELGNTRTSGIVMGGWYDADNNSTPFHTKMMFVVPAIGTDTRVYTPATRDTGVGGSTLRLNRTVTTPQAAYEATVSFAMFTEIAR